MKKIILIAIFLVTGVTSAQIKLTGVVKDSIGEPLEMANVIAIDTVAKTISSFGFSDGKGNYKLITYGRLLLRVLFTTECGREVATPFVNAHLDPRREQRNKFEEEDKSSIKILVFFIVLNSM